jgi:rhodanese-related sulfurtransferase
MQQGFGRSQWNLVFLILVLAAFWYGVSGRSIPKVSEVGLTEGKALVDAGVAVIDVRGAEAFGHRHIPGAINIPITVLRATIPASIAALKSQQIVVYCNDGVRTGPEATHLLNKAGFPHAANLTKGIEGWADAGHPLAR